METQKIPDSVLLKLEREENGKLKAYIDELEFKIQKSEENTKEQKEAIKKGDYYIQLKNQANAIQKKYKDLKDKYRKMQHELIMIKSNSEKRIIKQVNEMCEESLSPDNFEKWEYVKKGLELVRKDLINQH